MKKNSTVNKSKIGAKAWSAIVIFGLFGQIAWSLENMYFNVFMDRTVTRDPVAIAIMVGASAVIATATTLVMGIFSDKKGNRKRLISWGYIIWGLSVLIFAAVSVENTIKIFRSSQSVAITLTVAIIVLLDCIMSAIGSTANDAAFNAWVTDISDETNRGTIEGVLAIMPLLAMAVIFGAFDPLTQNLYRYSDGTEGTAWKSGSELIKHGNWLLFFILLGSLVSLAGIVGLFIVKDKKDLRPNKHISYKDIVYGFRLSVIKSNKSLYIVLLMLALYGIANQAYLPYLIIYFERTLGIANYIVPIIVVGLLSAIASVVLGILFDKFGKSKFLFFVAGAYVIGAVLMTIISPLTIKSSITTLKIAVPAFLLMTASLALATLIMSAVRDLTPSDKVGLFQGVRMVFMVLIPMIIGPAITAILTKTSNPIGLDEFGEKIYAYTPYMFTVAAAIIVCSIPLLIYMYKHFKRNELNDKETKNSLQSVLEIENDNIDTQTSDLSQDTETNAAQIENSNDETSD